MKECCKNCAFKANMEKWDYKTMGKENMPFYVCTMFWKTENGPLIYMYNSKKEEGMCEMFTPKNNG